MAHSTLRIDSNNLRSKLGLSLDGKVAVVTGGCGGIGAAVAEALAALGASVAIWDLNETEADKIAQSLPGSHHLGVGCDVTSVSSIDSAALKTVSALKSVDIVVNSAGAAGPTHPIQEIDAEEWRNVHALNLDSVHFVSRRLAPGMVNAGWGRIVNVASIAAMEGNANAAAYSSAKAGVVAYTKAHGKELAGTGVLVNCIAPAAVDTPFFDSIPSAHKKAVVAKIPLGRLGTATEVARMIIFLATDMCQFSTGAVFDVSGGRATN